MVELAVLCGEGLTPVCESGLHHEAVGGGEGGSEQLVLFAIS